MGSEIALMWLLAEGFLYGFAAGFNEGQRQARRGEWDVAKYVPGRTAEL
jgi:hypothetical protein